MDLPNELELDIANSVLYLSLHSSGRKLDSGLRWVLNIVYYVKRSLLASIRSASDAPIILKVGCFHDRLIAH
jgi:hypothetical protein